MFELKVFAWACLREQGRTRRRGRIVSFPKAHTFPALANHFKHLFNTHDVPTQR
jgi:hypothetical protein